MTRGVVVPSIIIIEDRKKTHARLKKDTYMILHVQNWARSLYNFTQVFSKVQRITPYGRLHLHQISKNGLPELHFGVVEEPKGDLNNAHEHSFMNAFISKFLYMFMNMIFMYTYTHMNVCTLIRHVHELLFPNKCS